MGGEAGKGVRIPKSLDRYVEGWERTFGKGHKSTAQFIRETLDAPRYDENGVTADWDNPPEQQDESLGAVTVMHVHPDVWEDLA